MTKSAKVWIIIGIILILIGCIIFGGVMMALNFDFKKLSTVKYETNDYIIEESFSDIYINTDTADILFVAAEGTKTSVVCYEETKAKHTVMVENGTLMITNENNKKWYDHIGISFGNAKITVNIPVGEYGDITLGATTGDIELASGLSFKNMQLSVTTGDIAGYFSASGSVSLKTTTGDIDVENITAGSLELSVTTGKVNVTDVACTDLTATGTTGDLTLENVIANGKL